MTDKPRSVAFCTPTHTRPHSAYLAALEAAIPALDAAGIPHQAAFKRGSPYISHARAELLRAALDAQVDDIVFIDHDVSFEPADLIKLIQTPGDVVSGLYRFKIPEEEYMGALATDEDGKPIVRDDGCIKAEWIPAGFMKITKEGVDRFMRAYPELTFGPKFSLSVDLFNHGAHDGLWWGEDYAFSRRWNAMEETIWVIPDLNLTHHHEDKAYPGNLHRHLLRQPGGSEFSEAA